MKSPGFEPLIDRYQGTCTEVDEEFARNRRIHGARIQCRPGCSDCCHQLFQITEIEAAHVSAGVRNLPDLTRKHLIERAISYMEARQKLVAVRGEPEAWGSLPAAGSRLACPALQDGTCLIYKYRPLICRKFGIPLYNPEKPGRVFACELNFRDGEAIEDRQLVTIQTGIHDRWKQLQRDYNDAAGHRDSRPITVARAIVEDFTFCLKPDRRL
jgi:Fe-S-cluster containining protein